MRAVRLALPALMLLSAPGCGGGLRAVPTEPQPPQAPQVRVQKGPPAARIEVIPLARGAGCSWLDGHYEPRGSEWAWVRGQWVHPPRGCFYAQPTTRYEETKDGVLLIYRPGAWYPRRPDRVCEVVLACESSPAPPSAPASDGSPAEEKVR